VQHVRRDALVSRLADHERVVEVGIGRRTAIAGALARRGCAVTATDVRERAVPPGVRFVVDDVTDPARSLYAGADVIYALNLPPELQRPARDLARAVGVPLWFTTLGGDPVVIPVRRETIPGGALCITDGDVDERDATAY